MPDIQDVIEFQLVAEETVVNDTVKITANLAGLVPLALTETELKDQLRDMMRRFISDATWQFSGLERRSHASGREEFALLATTRVSESENHGLDQRARDAAKADVRIASVSVDTAPPQVMVEDCEARLRISLLRKALEQRELINSVAGDPPFRLHHLSYHTAAADLSRLTASNTRAIATMSAQSYGSGMDDEGNLGNALKLAMRATVKLARSVSA